MFLNYTFWKFTITNTHIVVFIAGFVALLALYGAYFLKIRKMHAVDRYKRVLRKKPIFYVLTLVSFGVMGAPPFLVADPKDSLLVIAGLVVGALLFCYCLLYFMGASYAKKRLKKLQG